MKKIVGLIIINIIIFTTVYQGETLFKNSNIISDTKESIIIKVKEENITYIEEKYDIKNISRIYEDMYLFQSNEFNPELITNLNNDKLIQFAEIDKKVSNSFIEEPYYNRVWAYYNNLYPDITINIESAWEITKGHPDIVIGVIDSGITTSHEDLNTSLWKNPNEICDDGIDNDSNGYTDDCHGYNFVDTNNNIEDIKNHGTPISGIISSSVNSKGILGVAPNSKIMTLKASNSEGTFYLSDVITSIYYAKPFGVKIYNMSFVTDTESLGLKAAIEDNSDALFVVAAGNDGKDIDLDKIYPASYGLENIIVVGALSYDGSIASFSNYGKNTVDVFAPGVGIYTTDISGGYSYISGTSIATPIVAGQAALILSQNPNLTPLETKNIIAANVKIIASLQEKAKSSGLIDVHASLSQTDIKVTSIATSNYYYLLKPGEAKNINATVLPADATNKTIVFTSSDPSVATVNSSGEISAIKNGSTTITVRSADNGAITNIPLIVDSASASLIKGDIDGDKQVTITDLILLRRFLAGLEKW